MPGREPNVVVIMTDEQKARAIRLYGNPDLPTPSLERLAGEGVLFTSAFSPHPLCVPTRVSFWTGRWPHSHGSRTNELLMAEDQVHAIDLWREQGYATALIGKNHCFKPSQLARFDRFLEVSHRGPANPRGARQRELCAFLSDSTRWISPTAAPVNPLPPEVCTTHLVCQASSEFIRQQGEEPFALWVSIPDPHQPITAPEPYASMFPPEKVPLPPWVSGEMEGKPERHRVYYEMMNLADEDEHDVRRMIAMYYAMIRFIDDGVGMILKTLEQTGLRDNTIVVFFSDHGDFVGEHCVTEKGGMFYDCLVHVPLIISWPGRLPAGHVEENLVSLIDVVPTLLRLTGLPVPTTMQGRLLPPLPGCKPRDAVFAEYGAGGPRVTLEVLRSTPWPVDRRRVGVLLREREAEGRPHMIRTREWKLVHDPMGDMDELYDLRNDPWELTNLAEDAAYAGVVGELKARLLDWSLMHEDARPVPLYFRPDSPFRDHPRVPRQG